MSDSLPVVDINGVNKTYSGHRALADVSFSIMRGECFALLGPNGAGKTTLLRMLTNILKPDTGTVSVFGEEDLSQIKDRVGYLPEERGLYKKEKIGETLTYFGQLKGLSAAQARVRTLQVLQSVGMEEYAQSKPEVLSKGMAQRIQFAAAIIHDPEFVIFDEPFSGLDPVSAHAMQDLLLAEKSRGRTLLLSTHQMEPVERLCDRLVMLRQGQVMLHGSLEEARTKFQTGTIRVEHEGILPIVDGAAQEFVSPNVTRLRPETDLSPPELLRLLVAKNAAIRGFVVESPSLEEIFRRVASEGGGS